MMLKANGEYLDFRGDIEIENKVKLFEDIETADGDLSFSFDLNLTSDNLRILGIPIPDSSSKVVYQTIPCEVQSDQGLMLNRGSLRIERVMGYIASCSFLGGNSNWFGMISGNMTELNLTRYDVDQTYANIVASWSNTEGIVYPFLDLGGLLTRSINNAKTEDFVGCFYLHTLFKELFQQSGIKLQGDLLEDSLYNQIVIATNTRSKDAIDDRKVYVGKETPQLISPTPEKVTFDQFDDPYYVDAVGLFVNSTYTADFKMSIQIEVTTTWNTAGPVDFHRVFIYKNGVEIFRILRAGVITNFNINRIINAGDTIEVWAEEDSGSTNILGATLKITPVFIYNTIGNSTVPLWTKQQFVSNVLRAFNCITSFNSITKTLTIDIFDKIKTKESIDLSDYVSVNEIDYIDFISNYGKSVNFKYQEGSDENLRLYNISSFVRYGAGVITVDNDYIENSADAVELDFTSPTSYLNDAFSGSLERIEFVELVEDVEGDVTSISDSSGTPRFNVANADDFYEVNDLIRIEVEDDEYNGDYVITAVTSTYIEVNGLAYSTSSTGIVTKMVHRITTNDEVYWFVNIPSRSSQDLFGTSGNYLDQTFLSDWTLAFFNLIRLGKTIEMEYKQGLSFGSIQDNSSYQKSLIDKYWQQFSRVLNDPVKLITTGHLPWKVYHSIDFLKPITIRTLETSNLYYVNRILGYMDSSVGCDVDLIKLP